MQENYAWGNIDNNAHHNYRFPWVARTTRKNYTFIGYYISKASVCWASFTLSISLSRSVPQGACWPKGFAYCSPLDTILIAAMDTLPTAPAVATVPPFWIKMPPSNLGTTLLSVTSSTSSMDPHLGHLLATQDSLASLSPTTPLHPSLSEPLPCWETFSQWRKQIFREPDEAVETFTSVSTRMNSAVRAVYQGPDGAMQACTLVLYENDLSLEM